MSGLQKIVVIGGTTCAGKTETSLALARLFPSRFEIVNFDSVCFYKYFNIGTAKPREIDKIGIKHNLFDIKFPNEEYNAHLFALDAEKAIKNISDNGKIPLFVGGTALYIKSLLYGFSPIPEINKIEIRQNIAELIKKLGLPAVYEKLKEIDLLYADTISANDRQRITRALEVYESTGRPLSGYLSENPFGKPAYNYIYFALLPPKDYLWSCITKRTEEILKAGLINEIKGIIDMGYSADLKPFKSIGYKEGLMYLNGKFKTENELFQSICIATRQYAKRQATYFKKADNKIVITSVDINERIEIMKNHLNNFFN